MLACRLGADAGEAVGLARRDHQGVVRSHVMDLVSQADLQGPLQDHYRLVFLVIVERSAGALADDGVA